MSEMDFVFLDETRTCRPVIHRAGLLALMCEGCGQLHETSIGLDLALSWEGDTPTDVFTVVLSASHASLIARDLLELAEAAKAVELPNIHEPSHLERSGEP